MIVLEPVDSLPNRTRGERLRAFRLAIPHSLGEFARMAGIGVVELSDTERGRIPCSPQLYRQFRLLGYKPVVVVCGGRNYADVEQLVKVLDTLSPARIVTGDASGADALARLYANLRNIPYTAYQADWDQYGKKAGPIRNQTILDENHLALDVCVAFPGGPGTADMINRCKKAILPVFEIQRSV